MKYANPEFIATFNDDDEDHIPIGWEDVRLTEQKIDALCEAVDLGDEETANKIVDGAYARLFGATLN